MATAQYATGLALTQVLGLDLWVCVLLVGGLVTVYASLGGIKAIIWTDVVQAVLMLGAMVLTIGVCVFRVPEGAAGIWALADEAGKLRLIDMSWSFFEPTTQSMIIGATFSILASYRVDQVIDPHGIGRWSTHRVVPRPSSRLPGRSRAGDPLTACARRRSRTGSGR